MRAEIIVAVLSLALAGSPAWAADMSNGQGPGQSDQMPGSSATTPSPGQQNAASGLQNSGALKQSLEHAGFSNVQIAPQSYVVHAKGPDGQPVVMMITPDSVAVAKPQTAELPNPDQDNQSSGNSSQFENGNQSGTAPQSQTPNLYPNDRQRGNGSQYQNDGFSQPQND